MSLFVSSANKPSASIAPHSVISAEMPAGLEKGASRDDIVSAHKRLIQKLHPDRGGNDYLAAKVNAAKDQLLDGK